jgi:hypothetical protein
MGETLTVSSYHSKLYSEAELYVCNVPLGRRSFIVKKCACTNSILARAPHFLCIFRIASIDASTNLSPKKTKGHGRIRPELAGDLGGVGAKHTGQGWGGAYSATVIKADN